jgi:biotin transport system substrate-specific component
LGWLALAVLATATASRLSVDLPLTPVPQTAQTLAVLAAGIVLGSRWGAIAMLIYVVLGAVGLPVFAGGAAGLDRMTGPTSGFLLGFIPGAAIAGWWVESGRSDSLGGACLGMVIAHVAILFPGWLWLATSVGPVSAWLGGVAPFLLGAAGKSVLAGVGAYGASRRRFVGTHT